MRSRALRPIAVLLGTMLLTNTPAYAGPVTIGNVIQLVSSYQNPPSLRLRGVSQTSSTPVASTTASSPVVNSIDGSAVSLGPNSLLDGITFDTQDPQKTVTVATQGEVESSLCDCGFVTVAGGFPKWPLLFLAGIPLFFIDKDSEGKIIPNSTPTPIPNPTPTTRSAPVPEPASLLLFGSGLAALGAGLRRRRIMAKLKMQSETTEEG